VVFAGDRQIQFHDFPDPEPGPGQVIVQIKASGMCGSDLRPYRQPAAEAAKRRLGVAGHEPCGVVAKVAPGVPEHVARVGDRVMVHHYSGCGVCKMCRIGYTQMCVRGGHKVYGFSADGGHAPSMLCEATMCIPLPDNLTFAEGAAISCGTGTAYMALKRLDVSGRDTLAVFGQGPVGLSATLLARAMGARVIAVDVDADRLALARKHGAAETVDGAGDPVAAIRALTHGEGADATLDCTGNATARANAVKSARAWGRACFVGEGGTVTLEPSPDVIHKQLTIYGSWTFSTVGLAECAQFIADRQIPLRDIITHEFRLDQADEAYKLFDGGRTGKCVFVFN
jgi:threonine dehydrogenase-like Zn-dependent dehydrogenase